MKKLILILFFTLLTATSFAQASAASARMFKNSKAWKQREYLRTNREYTLDTAELYAIVRLSKDFEGHVNWQYATSNIANTFSSLFPILGRTNLSPMIVSYYNFQTGVRYLGHEIKLTGSPTLSNNSIVFNGTTQYGRLRFFREWDGTSVNMTPRLLMDTILNVSATDTAAQTNMNLAVFMKDNTDRMRFGASNTPSAGDFRILNIAGTAFAAILYNQSQGTVIGSIANSNGLYSTSRKGLTDSIYLNGSLIAAQTNASYDFGLARDITNPFFVQAFRVSENLVAGSVQFISIMNRGYTATEQTFFNNAVAEFVRRKTQ